ncbi:DNA repair protein RecO [Kushneria aurantia]|uniref:DNA repair protein RecO n=1 Tax=Kushneria aurantia TaxID=504092 RepID=A0ABV6G6Z1_9GAMM|nr:DNA repair protein RecO [Kushneria aurantia]
MSLQPAWLLHRRAWRETSALVDLLTLYDGRIRGVARGVMRPGSRTRHRLQSFAPLHVSWRGDGDLKTLRDIESRGPGALLAGEGLICGLYANELMTRLLPLSLPVETLFAFYAALLEALPFPDRRAAALRRFEITLLEVLDAEPVFLDPLDRALDDEQHYLYDPALRRFRPAEEGRPAFDARTLQWLARGDWESAGVAGSARALVRQALAPLLGERELHSRQLMRQLVRRRRGDSGA